MDTFERVLTIVFCLFSGTFAGVYTHNAAAGTSVFFGLTVFGIIGMSIADAIRVK
jgi:hypothetical protein